jgi:hypothetical protein
MMEEFSNDLVSLICNKSINLPSFILYLTISLQLPSPHLLFTALSSHACVDRSRFMIGLRKRKILRVCIYPELRTPNCKTRSNCRRLKRKKKGCMYSL